MINRRDNPFIHQDIIKPFSPEDWLSDCQVMSNLSTTPTLLIPDNCVWLSSLC